MEDPSTEVLASNLAHLVECGSTYEVIRKEVRVKKDHIDALVQALLIVSKCPKEKIVPASHEISEEDCKSRRTDTATAELAHLPITSAICPCASLYPDQGHTS